MARTGLKRHPVVIEYPVEVPNTTVGGTDVTWEAWPMRWADEMPGNGREFQAAQQRFNEITHLLEVRFDPDRIVTAKMRLVFNGETLEVVGAPRVRKSGQNEIQRLNCRVLDA